MPASRVTPSRLPRGAAGIRKVLLGNCRLEQIADGRRHDLDARFVERVLDVLGQLGSSVQRLLRVIERRHQRVRDRVVVQAGLKDDRLWLGPHVVRFPRGRAQQIVDLLPLRVVADSGSDPQFKAAQVRGLGDVYDLAPQSDRVGHGHPLVVQRLDQGEEQADRAHRRPPHPSVRDHRSRTCCCT